MSLQSKRDERGQHTRHRIIGEPSERQRNVRYEFLGYANVPHATERPEQLQPLRRVHVLYFNRWRRRRVFPNASNFTLERSGESCVKIWAVDDNCQSSGPPEMTRKSSPRFQRRSPRWVKVMLELSCEGFTITSIGKDEFVEKFDDDKGERRKVYSGHDAL